MTKRNPYARSLRIHRQQVVPDKREKSFREHLNDTLAEGVTERFKQLLEGME